MFTDLVTVKQLELEVPLDNFWKSIGILITKPYALNRNIGGSELFDIGLYSEERVHELQRFTKNLLDLNLVEFSEVKNLLKNHLSVLSLSPKTTFVDLYSNKTYGEKRVLFLRLVFPRNGVFRLDIFDLICCDFSRNSVMICKLNCTNDRPHLLVSVPYAIKYSEGTLRLSAPAGEGQEFSLNFLRDILFPKLCSWISANLQTDQIYSLSMVQVENYVVLYNELKKKYVQSIKEIWTESTNVEKFIHEDIAIATYLILLWKNKPQRFVDLGCGNGLLVYILNSEGHLGLGIDVRARKIWQKYPSSTVLKVLSIIPSDNMLFPEADWIIGNHSDELTPWIPVISFRSSYKTNFFLLPCCAYEFDGKKYSRSNTYKSQYLDYMDYIEEICKKCGFITVRDRLRIPSTKRLCFVSIGRSYIESEKNQIDVELIELIQKHSMLNSDTSGKWLDYYKPRETKEKVRNCTQLSKQLINDIVNHICNLLLENTGDVWNEGTTVKLSDIVHILPAELLQQLKKEHGGVQTILKNHQHIFQLKNGNVKFRRPVERKVKENNWKRKSCWFFNNHPHSCPLPDAKCSYKHIKEEK